MPPAEVVVLPVIRVERGNETWAGPTDRTEVVDLNAFRYSRERAAQERRAVSSLIEGVP
jgi:hypothetical protein